MVQPFIILFLLGGLQGYIGWRMVSSGLNDTDMYVKHTWLATHFLSALTLMGYTLWFAVSLLVPAEKRAVAPGLFKSTIAVIALLALQLAYGAFMAGLHAGKSAPTWPTVNGMWVPDTLHHSLVSNPINVQFIHRCLAYVLIIVIGYWFVQAGKTAKQNPGSILAQARWWPMVLVLAQVTLGIVTVLCAPLITFAKFGIYETLAETHQLVGMFLLMSLVVNLYIAKPGKA